MPQPSKNSSIQFRETRFNSTQPKPKLMEFWEYTEMKNQKWNDNYSFEFNIVHMYFIVWSKGKLRSILDSRF